MVKFKLLEKHIKHKKYSMYLKVIGQYGSSFTMLNLAKHLSISNFSGLIYISLMNANS